MTDEPAPVKSAATTLRVIQALEENGSTGVSELAMQLDMSKSAVHGHLATLSQFGYVVRGQHGSRLSLRFFDIGTEIRDRQQIYSFARGEVDKLAELSGFNAGIVVEEGGQGLCIYSHTATNDMSEVFAEGESIPLHATGVGKAILAEMPKERRDGFLSGQEKARYTEETITDPEQLNEEFDKASNIGVAYGLHEYREDVHSIGTAVTDIDGGVLGGIFVAGTSDQLTGKQLRQNIQGLLISATNELNTAISSSAPE